MQFSLNLMLKSVALSIQWCYYR